LARTVAIDEIIVDRALGPDDDLTDLTQSIDKDGIQVPILLTQDLELIDGLRRLEALRSLGHTTTEAVVTYMYPMAAENLEAAVKHGLHAKPLTGTRIWEIYSKMQPLLYITRSFYQRGKRKGTQLRSAGGRVVLAKALGMRSASLLQVITQVHRAVEVPETAAKATEAIKLIEAGEMTYYQGVDFLTKKAGLQGDVVNAAAQLETLDAAATSMNALVRALGRLGPLHKKVPKEEVEAKIAELAYARAKLTKTIKLLTKENTER
jgi:hypothetical protein